MNIIIFGLTVLGKTNREISVAIANQSIFWSQFLKLWDIRNQNIDNENKCSRNYVCRIVLQRFNIKIQKSKINIKFSKISHLPFDMFCFSL